MRMQLKGALVAAPLLAYAAGAHAAGGNLTERATTEMAAYSDTNHVAVLTPSIAGRIESPTAGWSIDGLYLVDVVSAASVDIISTASQRWTEVRQAGNLRGAYKSGDWDGSVQGSVSNEPDYVSYAAGATVGRDFDEKNVSLLAGYGYAHDTIGRTGTPFSVYSHTLERHAFTASASLVLDRRTVLAIIGDLGIERGDPSKPYRYIPLFAPDVAPRVPAGATLDVVTRLRGPATAIERLPLARDRFALAARLAHRFPHSTVRLEARLYDDSWSVAAFASDARLLFDVGSRWSLGPHLRYYLQSAASFWRLAYPATSAETPAYRTGDRELGPLMNLTGGGRVRWAVGPAANVDAWAIGADVEATYSRYFGDLYIAWAAGALATLTLEAKW